LVALQRQLNQARQDLLDAYEHARAARYQPGSAELAILEDAERRYQRTRSHWQDRNHRRPGPQDGAPACSPPRPHPSS
jgi:hypothetical protein